MVDLTPITALVQDDLVRMQQLLDQCLHSEITLIPKLSKHLVDSGGKRLRPLLVLLSAYALNYTGQAHIPLAASLELIHSATLLHDDVVDASGLRRGKKTANTVWGNAASILVGDFLYSRAFQLIVNLEYPCILQSLAEATNIIAEGEILQLLSCRDPDTNEQQCLRVIRAKTGTLFSIATQNMAMLAQRSAIEIQAMADYGMNLGIAFQLVDDAFDYCASEENIGKNCGDDLMEGKPTFPLIYALKHAGPKGKQQIRHAIKQASCESLTDILATIEATGAIAYTYQLAKSHLDQAFMCLCTIPESPYRDALAHLLEFVVQRTY